MPALRLPLLFQPCRPAGEYRMPHPRRPYPATDSARSPKRRNPHLAGPPPRNRRHGRRPHRQSPRQKTAERTD